MDEVRNPNAAAGQQDNPSTDAVLSRRSVLLAASCLTVTAATGASAGTRAAYNVILLIGQSNMVGYGTGPDDAHDAAESPRLFQWDGNNGVIIPAVDPLVQNQPPAYVGMGMTFGKAYLKTLPRDRHVLLVGSATGSTSFISGRWQAPDGDLVVTALARANAAMQAAGPGAIFAGVIWHQGESDVLSGGQDAYQANLTNLIAYLRANIAGAGPATPWVAGEFTYPWIGSNLSDPTYGPAQAEVLNDFHTLPDTIANTAWVSSVGLAGDQTWGIIHFCALSQRELGFRYADKFFEAANDLPQPQVSQVGFGGGFWDNGRGYQNADLPVSFGGVITGTVTSRTDRLLGNVAEIEQQRGTISYGLPGETLNGNYTKMVWFAPGAIGYANNLISSDNPAQSHFLLAQSATGSLRIQAGHAGGTAQLVDVAVTIAAGRKVWVNIALTYDANAQTMTIYVNGVPAASAGQIAPATPLDGITTVTLGGYGGTPGFGVDGRIGRARIWNVALTAAQISSIFSYESHGIAGF